MREMRPTCDVGQDATDPESQREPSNDISLSTQQRSLGAAKLDREVAAREDRTTARPRVVQPRRPHDRVRRARPSQRLLGRDL